jgi:hypothetical protein
MNIIQGQKQKYWQMAAMSALLVGGAIASSGEYAFAQIQVIPLPCKISPTLCNSPPPIKDPPHNPALPQALLKVIKYIEQDDPYVMQKLISNDAVTILKLEQLSAGATLRLYPYLQQLRLQPEQLNYPAIIQQLQ